MVSSRKRTIDEVTDNGSESEGHSLLHRIRNMWQFANLCQWVYIFGKIVKIDDRFDTEEIETECLKPNAPGLQEIGLALLKSLSSHRGLTPELFDEYTRRQYVSKAPEKPNPFGAEETPASFASFDVFTKIRILQQMTAWVLRNPEKVREKMEESKDSEQTQWRIEPMGWDSDDRTYFVLDDNRVYRLTDAPLEPAPTPKKKSKASRKGGRSSKRRRVSAAQTATEDAEEDEAQADEKPAQTEPEDDGFGGQKWECLAVTLDEVRDLISSFRKTRDENEKVLRDQLEEHLLPILEKQEESRKRKVVQRERELLNLAKMANAKRSSRLANKQEQQEHDKKAREEDERRRVEEIAERKAEKERLKLEKERDQRLASRENRLKDREARRQQHEEELASLSEDSRQTSEAPGRMSERRLHVEIERRKLALQEIAAEDEEDDWIFDCVCGVYGQVDDGTHSVACEKCNVWQHSKCLGISEDEAEQSDFHFVCSPCRRKEEAKSKPRTTIKLKINRPGSSTQTSPANDASVSGSTSVVVAIPSRLDVGGKPNEAQPSNPVATPAVAAKTEEPLDVVVGTKAPDNYPRTGQSSSFNIAIDADAAPTDTKTNGIVPVTPGFGFPNRNEEPTLPYSNGSPSKRSVGRGSRSPVHELGIHSSPVMGGASLLSTPGMKRNGEDALPPSTLPSSEAGHSPTKHSPVVPRPESASSAFSKTSNFPAVFPPLTTLAPSPRQPILTPPTKQTTEPARPPPPEFVRPAEGA
ncbi:hypothetical protein F5X68DRAFT_170775 [Plectosphaerella plurivora]|uniref:Zinc finger PHD-type domain-containing protein n=1 Tax=Plectosphaerella plurivora TaxID=936078 RepID=A0A9P8V954_9PEZI|nr:hypothetical protein F5X68DRAFT_170775 [Plectosphaerella plurivora]